MPKNSIKYINKRISFDTTTTAFNFETFGKILNEMKETNSKFHKNIDKLIQDIKSNQLLLDQNNNLYSSETILDKQFEITEKNILIKKASCNYGLDNQFEIIKYDKENNLLIYIDNSNDLVLNLIGLFPNKLTILMDFPSQQVIIIWESIISLVNLIAQEDKSNNSLLKILLSFS